MILFADVGGTNTRVWKQGKGKVEALVIGMRGVWTPAEKAAWKKKLRGIAPKILVLSDIELAHYLAFGLGPGVVLNAGTGSIAFGRNARGETARAGGLGPLIGDDGSAFWIGREYLRLRYQISPDIGPIRPYVTGNDAVAKIAGLAKTVLKIAEKKPRSFEARIVNEAYAHLRDLVGEVRAKLKISPSTPVQMTGGLFDNRFFKAGWRKFLSRV